MTIRAGGSAMQAHAVPDFLAFNLCPVPGVIQTAEPLVSEQCSYRGGWFFARTFVLPDFRNTHWRELTRCVLNRSVPLAQTNLATLPTNLPACSASQHLDGRADCSSA